MRIPSALLPQNEGTLDRVIRVTLGATLLLLAFVGPRSAWGLAGLLPLATGLLGSCPTYRLFGASTHPSRDGLGEVEKNGERWADGPLPTARDTAALVRAGDENPARKSVRAGS